MVANCSTISSVLFFIDPCCTLQHNILIVFDLLFKNVFSFPCRNPFKTSFFLINDISTHPAWFCWQHQPAVDLVGPEAETQAQEEQSRTSFTPNPRVPGAATQPQRAPQTEPSGELRRPGPGTYHHEHNIRFCRDYKMTLLLPFVQSVFVFSVCFCCGRPDYIPSAASNPVISIGFQQRAAGPSSSSFPLRRSDSLMSEASGNNSLTQTKHTAATL